MLKEWPLVAFTILGQAAVGLFVIGLTPFVIVAPLSSTDTRLFLALLAAVFCLLLAAALLSFLHLHHPLRAVRALSNVRTSWLSREILFELLFMALVAVELVLARACGAPTALRIVYGFAGLTGVLYLLSMVKIYMLASLPSWNQAGTPLLFVSTSLSLGALSAGSLGGGEGFFYLAIPLISLDLAVAFFFSPGHGLLVRRAVAAIRPPGVPAHALHVAALGLEMAGLILFAGVSLTALGDRLNGIFSLVLLSLIVLAAQVLRRFAFYGLAARSRLLGSDQVK